MLPSETASPDKKCGSLSTNRQIELTYCINNSSDYAALCQISK